MKKNIHSLKKYFPFIVIVFVLSGCGIWEDFTTYFNLYYNTKDKFTEAEEAIKQQRKNLFEFEEPNISGNVPTLLNGVIEKCSKILQFHSGSSYVEDVLLMLGKCFYYQKNYLKALRKFQELAATLPESDYILENDLWIAKTQMRLKEFEPALVSLKRIRSEAVEEGEDEIARLAYVEEIVHLIVRENYASAITLINEFLEVSDNDEVNAEVEYELGRLYLKTNELENAITAFEKVFDYSPTFEIELNSKLELASALREVGETEKTLLLLEEMRNENKYSDSFHKIDLEIGITLFSLNRVDESVELLSKVDTTYISTPSSGIARFKLAEIFETRFNNFDSASIYYTKAASSTAPQEYTKLAFEKSQLFRKYQGFQKNIFDAKKQLVYLEDPDAFIQDSIAFYSDTLSTGDQTSQPIQVEQGENELDNKGIVQPLTTQLQTVKKTPPERPKIGIDSVKSIIAKNDFDLANLFFTELNYPDSAYFYYRQIIDEYPDSKYYSLSLYSTAAYYNSLGQKEEADSILNFIYDNYKTESIVNAAAIQLKKPLVNLAYDPADELYSAAEKTMLDQKYSESIAKFYNIFELYPQSSLAPKALYASGWILENELKLLDSAAVLYDSINVRYPQSQYASSIKPKLSFYKTEVERKQKAIEDSLNRLKLESESKTETDSLNQISNPDESKDELLQIDEEQNKQLDEEIKRKEMEENDNIKPRINELEESDTLKTRQR